MSAGGKGRLRWWNRKELREKYGVPAVIIDDRMESRNAVLGANPGIETLSVGCAYGNLMAAEIAAALEEAKPALIS